MEYKELRTLEQAVNTRGSKLWMQMNDNSKAAKRRQMFVSENGGMFRQEGRYWTWLPPEDLLNGYWLKNVSTGEKVFFQSMTEFGKQHGLTPVKICELLNGKRKTYKGWTASELRAVKETEGSHVKAKKKAPVKIAIAKQATFQHTETKQIFVVDNINQFAKLNNLDAKAMYKVARGKAKSHKNFILFNPLAQTGD